MHASRHLSLGLIQRSVGLLCRRLPLVRALLAPARKLQRAAERKARNDKLSSPSFGFVAWARPATFTQVLHTKEAPRSESTTWPAPRQGLCRLPRPALSGLQPARQLPAPRPLLGQVRPDTRIPSLEILVGPRQSHQLPLSVKRPGARSHVRRGPPRRHVCVERPRRPRRGGRPAGATVQEIHLSGVARCHGNPVRGWNGEGSWGGARATP